MTNTEKRARRLIASQSTVDIIRDFELTEQMPMIRGWYMDELKSRNAEAFEKWIDSAEESPRKFYL